MSLICHRWTIRLFFISSLLLRLYSTNIVHTPFYCNLCHISKHNFESSSRLFLSFISHLRMPGGVHGRCVTSHCIPLFHIHSSSAKLHWVRVVPSPRNGPRVQATRKRPTLSFSPAFEDHFSSSMDSAEDSYQSKSTAREKNLVDSKQSRQIYQRGCKIYELDH